MAERDIGRVEEVDVALRERTAYLIVRLRCSAGGEMALGQPVSANLLRDYLDVWGVDALQSTLTRHCWIVHVDGLITGLEPLMADEGDALTFGEPAATSPATAPQPPATAPEAPEAKPTPEQGARWKQAIAQSRALKLNIEHCRPKPGMARDDVESLLVVAEALVAGEQAMKAQEAAA